MKEPTTWTRNKTTFDAVFGWANLLLHSFQNMFGGACLF
jgi:hypothetical protein